MKSILPGPILSVSLLLVICGFNPTEVNSQSLNDDQLKSKYTTFKDISYGPDEEQNMDIYLSEGSNELNKEFTIVFLHGGGYYFSDKSKEERYIKPYLEKGFDVVNMNYRLRRGISIATEDLTKALNFLQENNAEYNLKLKRIVATGFSAGAHIATLVGVTQNNREYTPRLDKGIKIIGIINFSGPVDGLDTIERIFTEHENESARLIGTTVFPETEEYADQETVSKLEPITYFDKKDPAIFIWHAGKDDQVPPETYEDFTSKIRESKDVLSYIPDGKHSPNTKELEAAYLKIFQFLNDL